MEIRKARLEDIDKIGNLYDDVCDYLQNHINYPKWKKGIYPIKEDAEDAFKSNTLFVALENNEIKGTFILNNVPEKGYSNVTWETENDYSRIGIIHILAVNPKFMKEGIGEKMINFIFEYARKNNYLSIRLDVVKDNTPAERLYKKCGFKYLDTISLGNEEYGPPWYNIYEKNCRVNYNFLFGIITILFIEICTTLFRYFKHFF